MRLRGNEIRRRVLAWAVAIFAVVSLAATGIASTFVEIYCEHRFLAAWFCLNIYRGNRTIFHRASSVSPLLTFA